MLRANTVRPYDDDFTFAAVSWDVEDAVPYNIAEKMQLLSPPI